MTLDEIFDHGKDAAKHLFEAQGEVHPMWIVETADGELFPVMMPIPTPDEKEAAIEALKVLLEDKKAVRYVSMVEAWVYEAKKGETMDDIMAHGPIREHPKRKEIVNVIAEDKYHSRSGYFPIVRPEIGRPYLSTFKHLPEAARMEGLFTHLLESAEASH